MKFDSDLAFSPLSPSVSLVVQHSYLGPRKPHSFHSFSHCQIP